MNEHRHFWSAALVLLLGVAVPAAAQPVDTLLTEAAVLVRFEDARALAVDPSGTLYVADAGEDVVVRLAPNGLVLDRLGGPGGAEGEFDEPSDIDPTNGLVLLVADAGNSRVQRFSREFRHLESLPVGRGYGAAGERPARPVYDTGFEDANELGSGRPIAVASTATDETLAIDAAQNVVVRWDAGRRARQVIGGFGEGDGALVEPVALALSPRGLIYVADRGRAAVLVYDAFGSYVRTLTLGRAEDVQALAFSGNRLWVVLPRQLLVYDAEGRLRRVVGVQLGAPLVDVARHEGRLYMLTATRLYATSWR